MPQLDYTAIVIVLLPIISTLFGGVITWLFVGRKKLKSENALLQSTVKVNDADITSKVDARLALLIDKLDERIDDLAQQNTKQAGQISGLMKSVGKKDNKILQQDLKIKYLQEDIKELKRILDQYEDVVRQWGKLLIDNDIIEQVEFDNIMIGIGQ